MPALPCACVSHASRRVHARAPPRAPASLHSPSVPRSQRGGEIVEPLVSEQWFVRMAPLAEPALAAVADGRITIMPERFEKIYNMWLENIKVGGAPPSVPGVRACAPRARCAVVAGVRLARECA